MELSESLRAVRFVRPGGDFVLFGHVWPPTEVMLGKADYPSVEQVKEQIREVGARLLYLDPDERPVHDNSPVPANVYVLGAVIGTTPLGSMLDAPTILDVLAEGRKADRQRNTAAFKAGLAVMTRA
jgi:indolepyruvate ferredoxin oxidoreductase beta subunit